MSRRISRASIALSVLIILAGCSGGGSLFNPGLGEDSSSTESTAGEGIEQGNNADPPPQVATPDANFSDPAGDPLGWESGYWYNESITVDQTNGLSDEEMKAYVGRGMARVEYIRQLEFKSSVPVSVISRSEYRSQRDGNTQSTEGQQFQAWNNQVWEALFAVGESASTQQAIEETRGSSVAGFYSPSDDAITIVTDTPESASIDNTTLIHELVHAVQDQHYDLTEERYAATTQDGQLAVDGLIEGDARYVESAYVDRCGGSWECVELPTDTGRDSGSGGGPSNLGIFVTIFQPYSDGVGYINHLRESGGWAAVNDRFESPPVASEQVIHRTNETPQPITYTDRSSTNWSQFESVGQDGSDTVGEASIFVMFWNQARTVGAETVRPQALTQPTNQYDAYNYIADPSAGWENDRLFPYRTQDGKATEYGYVWVTTWESNEDATEFRNAYRSILTARDATTPQQTGSENPGSTAQTTRTYVIPDGPYADSFRVTQDGTQVVIVNGPETESLDKIRSQSESTMAS
ncbi:Hvo_1808 family surface protein [Haloquadratum walsbyi]|jgi:hypothetical protein|uniref:Lipoprotein n=1 Tax=Haloquadratum walsbyi J07HQW2 TaxID=1238425 RepID=U1MZR5_9EURY|nr:Hvo_1808 family surface protein [Haloquadratum walsbyi]ERG96014.1 MAG: hypothetical protein J07HQW2_02481 [Haloquadratum walsbyi J07HQW2]